MAVTQRSDLVHQRRGKRPDSPLPLDRLKQDGACLRSNGLLQRLHVAEGHAGEARHNRLEAVRELRLSAGCDRRHGSTMEGVGEGQNAPALGACLVAKVAPHELQGEIDRLASGIREENRIRETGDA